MPSGLGLLNRRRVTLDELAEHLKGQVVRHRAPGPLYARHRVPDACTHNIGAFSAWLEGRPKSLLHGHRPCRPSRTESSSYVACSCRHTSRKVAPVALEYLDLWSEHAIQPARRCLRARRVDQRSCVCLRPRFLRTPHDPSVDAHHQAATSRSALFRFPCPLVPAQSRSRQRGAAAIRRSWSGRGHSDACDDADRARLPGCSGMPSA